MSDKFYHIGKGIDLTGQAAAPTNPTNGAIYYDKTLNLFQKYENGAWGGFGTIPALLGTAATAVATTGTIAQLSSATGYIQLTGSGAKTIQGINSTGITAGMRIVVENQGSGNATFTNVDSGAASNDRLELPNAASVVIPQYGAIEFIYDATLSKWLRCDTGATASTSGINYIANPNAEGDTTGWATYSEVQTVTISNASPGVVTQTAHGYSLGQRVSFTTTGGLPTGLTVNTIYYVSAVSTNTYSVSATLGGSSINTSSAGSGTHSVHTVDPVAGTGGSISGLAFSRSTSSPLRGTASFLLAQTNSTVVNGQGANYAFTIDSADTAKVLTVSCDYNASSTLVASSGATGSDSDIEFYMYDVTNAALIPISPKVITAGGSNNFTFKGTFQSSLSTSYRLIVHAVTPNANATGWSFKFDNVQVGPQAVISGSPVVDWTQNSAFVFSAGFGSPSASDVRMARVGDTLEVEGYIATGTTGASVAYVQLPPGMVIDASKYTATADAVMVGEYAIAFHGASSNLTATSNAILFYDGSTNNQIFFAGSSASSQFKKGNVNDNVSSTDVVAFKFKVRILGWSSNVQLSQDADTRVVAARYRVSTGQTGSSSTAWNFDTKDFDTHAAVTTGTWKFTAPVSGIYVISCSVSIGSATGFSLGVYKNGSLATYLGVGAAALQFAEGTTSINLLAGDSIDIRPDSSLTTSTDGNRAWVSINKLQGPATVVATELVAAAYHKSSSGSTTGNNPINFDTVDFDTHGVVTTGSSWRFTAPAAGIYSVSASVSVNTSVDVQLWKNGAAYKTLFYCTSAFDNLCGTSLIQLNVGDFIDIRASSTTTSNGGSGSGNYTSVSIMRLKN